MDTTATWARGDADLALIELGGRLARSEARARSLGEAFRRLTPALRGAAPSTLNGDASAVELCVTVAADRCRYRIIVDPATDRSDSVGRYRARRATLAQLVVLGGTPAMQPLFDAAIESWLPQPEAAAAASTRGVFWIGVGLDDPGAALYLEGAIGEPAGAWHRLDAWFARTVADARPARAFIDGIRAHGSLQSVGMEGAAPRSARVKFHWRLAHPGALAEIAPHFARPEYLDFLTLMMGERGVSLESLVFSAGFTLDGAFADAKIDVCGCAACLGCSAAGWCDRLRTIGARFGLRVPALDGALAADGCRGLLLGFGIDVRGRARLNFYAKPSPAWVAQAS